MKKKLDFQTFRKKSFRDEAFVKEYEALRPEFDLVNAFIKARKKAHLSQSVFAKRLHLQQPAIARLEKGGYSNTSITNLSKFARALGYTLKISLVPQRGASHL